MTHYSREGMDWLICDFHKEKALIIYTIKSYESRLQKYRGQMKEPGVSINELTELSQFIVKFYHKYLQLLEPSGVEVDIAIDSCQMDLKEIFIQIDCAKDALHKAREHLAEKNAVIDLIRYYYQFQKALLADECQQKINGNLKKRYSDFEILATAKDSADWLTRLLVFCNTYKANISEFVCLYFNTFPKELKKWVIFFTDQRYINLFYAVYYFKQHPEKLYDSQLSSEKLLSVLNRLDSIYQIIEGFHKQFLTLSVQHNLPMIKDYLFHGDELPPGIVIQVNPDDRRCIQSLVKLHAVNYSIRLDTQILHNKLYDLFRAYKFWFNPSRIVDAVMVLQQTLVNQMIDEDFNESDFREKMVDLYKHLNTTECLDLYGYFSNKDSCYLLRIFNAIITNQSLSWLPPLLDSEKKAISRVFHALLSIMEALREELVQRNIATEPYPINYAKPVRQPGRRNSGAVKRVIALYSRPSLVENSEIEALFDFVEK